MTDKKDLKIYCDSSLTESCFVLIDNTGTPPFQLECTEPYEFPVTVNQGEYLSVIRALDYALKWGYRDFQIFTDSQLTVRQINARTNKDYASPYQTKNKTLLNMGTLLISLLKSCGAELHHIGRAKNPAGIILEARSKK